MEKVGDEDGDRDAEEKDETDDVDVTEDDNPFILLLTTSLSLEFED